LLFGFLLRRGKGKGEGGKRVKRNGAWRLECRRERTREQTTGYGLLYTINLALFALHESTGKEGRKAADRLIQERQKPESRLLASGHDVGIPMIAF